MTEPGAIARRWPKLRAGRRPPGAPGAGGERGRLRAIDPVRFIGNRSSGRMGFALAERPARAAITAGGARQPPDARGVEVVRVRDALGCATPSPARREPTWW